MKTARETVVTRVRKVSFMTPDLKRPRKPEKALLIVISAGREPFVQSSFTK